MEKQIKLKLDNPIGLSDAAREFNINHLALSRAAKKGTVRAQQVFGRWLVERQDVERYAITYHQRARTRLRNLKALVAKTDAQKGRRRQS